MPRKIIIRRAKTRSTGIERKLIGDEVIPICKYGHDHNMCKTHLKTTLELHTGFCTEHLKGSKLIKKFRRV